MSTFLKECIIDPFTDNGTDFGIDDDVYEGGDGVMLTVLGCHYFQAGTQAARRKMTREGLEKYFKSLDSAGKIESAGWKYACKEPPELKVFFPGLAVQDNNEYSS